MAIRPLFSIITVCYNARNVLPGTLASLEIQDCKNYEWVVIDGGSTDGSVDWLTAQSPDFFSSGRDSGIYDAMNRAVHSAKGEWLYFLNAGDEFASENVLSDISRVAKSGARLDLIYGDVLYTGRHGDVLKRFHWLTRRRLLFGDLCHQAVFSHVSLFERHGLFDETLRFNADFDWFIRVFRKGARIKYTPKVIARFDDDGAHVRSAEACDAERKTVYARYCPRWAWLLGHRVLRLELRLRGVLRSGIY